MITRPFGPRVDMDVLNLHLLHAFTHVHVVELLAILVEQVRVSLLLLQPRHLVRIL